MTESAMAVVKPEMKSYIWLQTADGSIQQVEEEVAMFCPMICREILQTGMGSSKNYAISLPQRVNPAILGLILDYCRFHQVPGRSNKERKTFDEKFIRMDTKKLCELTSAADSLQLKPLVDLTSRALARIIEGKTPEEIRETFHLPDDLTEEEKLEPLRNITDDPRIRLLNRLYARKRKELREREKLKNVEIEERVDDRSVDDLLSFINGGDGDSKAVKTNKNKKKNRRRKDQQKDSSSTNENGNHDKIGELDALPSCRQNECNKILGASPSRTVKSQDSAAAIYSPKIEFDDGDIYDDLDPAMKEELDREVEDFARRLNSDWPERVQEILSLGQERKLVTVLNGNGSSPRFTSPNCTFGDLIAASGITDDMLDSLIALKDLEGVEGLPPLTEIEDMRYEKNTRKSSRAEIERQKQEEVAKARVRQVDDKGRAYGTGRRKCSIARVWIQPGDGKFIVNDKEFDVYFPMLDSRAALLRPFSETKTLGLWDVTCTVKGGGTSGQVGAVQLGISRALQNWEPDLRPPLRASGFLTRDARVVERKKPGKAKARKSFQWVKR